LEVIANDVNLEDDTCVAIRVNDYFAERSLPPYRIAKTYPTRNGRHPLIDWREDYAAQWQRKKANALRALKKGALWIGAFGALATVLAYWDVRQQRQFQVDAGTLYEFKTETLPRVENILREAMQARVQGKHAAAAELLSAAKAYCTYDSKPLQERCLQPIIETEARISRYKPR
jgi:hypothetical protein